MKSKKRENYQDFHERMEKKRVRKKVWKAWLIKANKKTGSHKEIVFFKPEFFGEDEVVAVEIRERNE